MIKQLSLTNIKSHENSILQLHPQINVIVGNTDSGKTNIRRALNWLVDNRPLGDNLLSDWILDKKENIIQGKEASVLLETEKFKIKRFRNKDANGYQINDNNPLEAIGTEVPEQVSKLLNLSEINIQRQIPAVPFLIGSPPGQIAKFLNSLVDLEEIDLFLSAIDSRKRENSKNIKNTEIQIQEFKEKFEKMSWVNMAETLLTEAEFIQSDLEKKQSQIDKLSPSIASWKGSQKIIKKLSWIPKAENLLRELSQTEIELGTKRDTVKKLNDSVFLYLESDFIIKKTKRISEAEKKLKSLIEIQNEQEKSISQNRILIQSISNFRIAEDKKEKYKNLGIAEKKLNILDKIYSRVKEQKTEKNSLGILINTYNTNKEALKLKVIEVEKLVKSLPDICPVCNGTGKLK